MKTGFPITLYGLIMIIIVIACGKLSERDIIYDPLTESQAEIREEIYSIVKDAETANIESIKAVHLDSDKFTKFGPRRFGRQDVKSTNESESAFFGSISKYRQEVKDLKIDVFGDIGIATYYPHVSFIRNGEKINSSGRQTFVFLKTDNGWKIVHEHGTPKQ
jgi:ketosteroid isomerase-like protein